MDVPPPWYTMTGETCSGEMRRCPGGDSPCRAQAERDGYVAISNYSFCRRDEVHTVPTVNAAVVVALAAGVVVAVLVARRSRARRRDG